MPPMFMISPARMNSGIAISAKTSTWAMIRCGRIARYRALSVAMKVRTEAAPSA